MRPAAATATAVLLADASKTGMDYRASIPSGSDNHFVSKLV
jgi:hypothetical protein